MPRRAKATFLVRFAATMKRVVETQLLDLLPERLVAIGPDPDDLPFVEVALAVPVGTIVTGNLADFPSEILNAIKLLTPVQALAELEEVKAAPSRPSA